MYEHEREEVTDQEFIEAVVEDIEERDDYYSDRLLYHIMQTAYPTELTQNN